MGFGLWWKYLYSPIFINVVHLAIVISSHSIWNWVMVWSHCIKIFHTRKYFFYRPHLFWLTKVSWWSNIFREPPKLLLKKSSAKKLDPWVWNMIQIVHFQFRKILLIQTHACTIKFLNLDIYNNLDPIWLLSIFNQI